MNITVLGGGSAGWITALLTQTYYPNSKITLIESEEIGILGAGEGTTGKFIEFLDKVKIPVSDLIKQCKATIKIGINFENWNGDGKSYFHHFPVNRGLNENLIYDAYCTDKQLVDGMPLDENNFSAKIAKNNKVPFSYINNIDAPFLDPILSFSSHAVWALHFDARLLAKYLRSVAESRGIIRVEGKLHQCNTNDRNNIISVELENGKVIDNDFIFDCSGFARLLVGKFYNTKWNSYNEYLPLDTALPFFIPHDGEFSPQTDSIAMKYGWVWRIPVDGRYGCGYVFDSSYINEEQAIAEAEEYFGLKLESPKTFKFKAGTYDKTLINNCMAIGLAQSFVEPLEATSILISVVNITEFLEKDGINKYSELSSEFNTTCNTRNTEVVNFLYAHYMTSRNDSPFWNEFREKHKCPEAVSTIISDINHDHRTYVNDSTFSSSSWVAVTGGLGMISPEKSISRISKIDNKKLNSVYSVLHQNQNNVISSCVYNSEFLNYMKTSEIFHF